MDEYQERYEQEKKVQLDQWRNLIIELVNGKKEGTIIVKDEEQIAGILDKVGKSKVANHSFMPSGGGLDLEGSAMAAEEGLIELDMGIAHLVKPDSLSINRVSDNPEWWYLGLDCSSFPASGVYEELKSKYEEENTFKSKRDRELEELAKYYGEELVEVSPMEYIERSYWDESFLGYDEDENRIPLPEEARLVVRMHNGGHIVIFPKYSLYNQVTGTYDGRHNLMGEEKFHEHVVEVVRHLQQAKEEN